MSAGQRWFALLFGVIVPLLAPSSGFSEDLSGIAKMDLKSVVSASRPEYPYEARRNRLTGSGIAVLEVDSSTGKVTGAHMGITTGQGLLDRAALEGFRRWRFKPGTASRLQTPITYTMTGGQFTTQYDVKAKNMDDVLAAFLGKGTVLKGPIPPYPRDPAWGFKQGKGIYELQVDKDGKVAGVRVLKSRGDAIFDRVTVKTLGRWRLRRGPLVLELPLRFVLTPSNYSVDVGR